MFSLLCSRLLPLSCQVSPVNPKTHSNQSPKASPATQKRTLGSPSSMKPSLCCSPCENILLLLPHRPTPAAPTSYSQPCPVAANQQARMQGQMQQWPLLVTHALEYAAHWWVGLNDVGTKTPPHPSYPPPTAQQRSRTAADCVDLLHLPTGTITRRLCAGQWRGPSPSAHTLTWPGGPSCVR